MSTSTDLRTLIAQATTLAADLDGQRQREAAAFAEGYRLAFQAGRDVGRAEVIKRIHAVRAEVNRELTTDAETLRAARLARESPDVTMPCRLPGCRGWALVHYRTRHDLVRCHQHQPVTWCPGHRANDRCAYLTRLNETRRSEHTGGPIPWESTCQI